MGTVVSKAANGIGTLVGNALAAPFKNIFGGSCEGICSGTWDIVCFIEHLCVVNLIKLLMMFILCYITFVFFYLLFKLGVCQCIGRNICKFIWAACETYWLILKDITCFCWYKLKNVKRVNRRRAHRFQDIGIGYGSNGGNDTNVYQNLVAVRNRISLTKRRTGSLGRSGFVDEHSDRIQHRHRHHHHHRHDHDRHQHQHQLKQRREKVLANIKSRPQGLKRARHIQMRKLSNIQREEALSKRRII